MRFWRRPGPVRSPAPTHDNPTKFVFVLRHGGRGPKENVPSASFDSEGDTLPSGELHWFHASTVPARDVPRALRQRAAELVEQQRGAEAQGRAVDDLNAKVWEFINADSSDP
jgi:hypothetical protein